jgi:hypothetical protein
MDRTGKANGAFRKLRVAEDDARTKDLEVVPGRYLIAPSSRGQPSEGLNLRSGGHSLGREASMLQRVSVASRRLASGSTRQQTH